MLQELSLKTNGQFFAATQWNDLNDQLKNTELRSIIHSTEDFREIIHLPWLLILIIILISAEWSIRKYSGGY